MSNVTAKNWKNKKGTSDRSCQCGTWKDHWINNTTNKQWPNSCSVKNCNNPATLGAHVINPDVVGERIIPACDSCNKLASEFDLKGGITIVKANQNSTCNN